MKRLFLILCMVVLHSGSWAQQGDVLLLPAVRVMLGDGSVRNFGPNDGQMRPLENGAMAWQLDSFSFGDGSVVIDPITVVYKTDPFITWGVGATSFKNEPVSFEFLFTAPYGAGPYDQLLSNMTATLQSEGTGALMSMSSIAHDSLVDSNVVVSLTTTLPDCAGTSSPLACGSTSGQTSVATLGSGVFSSRLKFTLDVPRTTAQLQGATILQTAVVPEPQTPALLLAGLLGVAAITRWRRAAR